MNWKNLLEYLKLAFEMAWIQGSSTDCVYSDKSSPYFEHFQHFPHLHGLRQTRRSHLRCYDHSHTQDRKGVCTAWVRDVIGGELLSVIRCLFGLLQCFWCCDEIRFWVWWHGIIVPDCWLFLGHVCMCARWWILSFDLSTMADDLTASLMNLLQIGV